MTCELCYYGLRDSCQYYHNQYTTDLLCIFTKLPNEMVHHITEYLYNYTGHTVSYFDTIMCDKILCTSCFQLGYYKIKHTHLYISPYNIIRYFNSWVDDSYIKEIQTYCDQRILPIKIDFYYNHRND